MAGCYQTCLNDRVLLRLLYQCRLEANYAHQQELDMIPLMMQKDYQPKGWRKCQCRVLLVLNYRRHAVDARELRSQLA